MSIKRGKPPAGLTEALSGKLHGLYGPCIECEECFGLCPSLIEALMLPDAVLKPHGQQADGDGTGNPDSD